MPSRQGEGGNSGVCAKDALLEGLFSPAPLDHAMLAALETSQGNSSGGGGCSGGGQGEFEKEQAALAAALAASCHTEQVEDEEALVAAVIASTADVTAGYSSFSSAPSHIPPQEYLLSNDDSEFAVAVAGGATTHSSSNGTAAGTAAATAAWTCTVCTLVNEKPHALACDACGSTRDDTWHGDGGNDGSVPASSGSSGGSSSSSGVSTEREIQSDAKAYYPSNVSDEHRKGSHEQAGDVDVGTYPVSVSSGVVGDSCAVVPTSFRDECIKARLKIFDSK